MPSTYEELLTKTLPARIEKYEEYQRIGARFGELLVKGRLTRAEERPYHLLALLSEDYDRRHAMPPDNSTPAELLQFLLDHSGKPASSLLPIFGQRSHVHEALKGKRPISAAQARKLGAMYHVKPGLFL